MNLNEARTLANRAIKLEDAGIEPARRDYGLIVQAFGILEESNWVQDRGLARKLDRDFPGILNNHDQRGNWIGNVANEDGWTA